MMETYSDNTNIGLRHMRAVIAVAEEGSFVAAAARLAIAPSALTETIKQVERSTGVTLFDRRSRPVQITKIGAEFLVQCRDVVELHGNSLRRLRRLGTAAEGSVSIAAAPSLIDRLVVPAIRSFRALHPQVEIAVHDDVGQRIVELVERGAADLGAGAFWSGEGIIRADRIGRDRVVLVLGDSHPMAARETLTLKDIAPEDVITLGASTGTARLLASSGQVPEALLIGRLRAHSTIAQLLMVRRGLGVALLPELAAHATGSDGLRLVRVADLDIWRQLYLLRRFDIALNPAAEAFGRQMLLEARRVLAGPM